MIFSVYTAHRTCIPSLTSFTCNAATTTILLLVLLFTPPAVGGAVQNITATEKAWLATHTTVRVQLAEDWAPYNYIEQGEPKGYVNEYVLLLAETLGITIDFVGGHSWKEYLAMLDDGQIDCISNMTITPERRKRYLFSKEPVVEVINGLLTLKHHSSQANLEKLQGKRLAVAKGYAHEELLSRYYPDIDLLTTENLLDSILQVVAGNADAAIGAHEVFNYYIRQNHFNEVISAPINDNRFFPVAPHHLAVHPDNKPLLSLLDKAASSVDAAELTRLRERWYSTKKEKIYLQFSPSEQAYLAEKKQLKLCADPDWMPMESIREGRHIGMAADYMQLLENRLGVDIRLVPTTSWQQTLDFAESRACDIISLAMSTPKRRLFLNFSAPLFTAPLVVATKASSPFIADFGALKGERVGVKKDYAFGHVLKEKYPEIDIVSVDTVEHGLGMVQDGRIHGFIGSLPKLVYTIQKKFPAGLKIAGNIGEDLELRMGLRNDEPLLLTAMDKAIASLSPEEHQEILNRWISVKYEEGVDYRLITRILVGGAILFALLLYRQVTLRGFNKELQQRNREIVKQAELLQKTQQKLLLTQHAVDSSSFPIFWIHYDLDSGKGHIVHANTAASTSLGYTVDELLHVEPARIAGCLATMENKQPPAAGHNNLSSPPATAFHRKDGSSFPAELHDSTFVYEEKQYRFIFFYDITMQQEMEAKLHRSMKMEAVGLMAGGVAHDLNNILSGVISYPELLLLELEKNSPLRPQIEAIKRSGEQAAAIVDDLLTMARGIAAVRQTANFNDILQEYLDSPEFRQLQKRFPRVRYSLHLATELENIYCSVLHMKKSVMNLITNAYEASPSEGTVVLSTFNRHLERPLASKNYLPAGTYAVFQVQDTGPGIPDSVISHIFEPFYSKKEMGKSGTGLGLAIVWNSAQDHGGSVLVENNSTGVKFELYLPTTSKEIDNKGEFKVDQKLLGDGEKILVIDDEPQLLDITCRMLERLGYAAHPVPSGEEGIKRLKKDDFDVVVLDMKMPGMNGKDTYAAMCTMNPGQKAIVMSGFSEDANVRATLSMGANAFIRKPFSLYTLAQSVHNALKESS